jgi:hypothetical protein
MAQVELQDVVTPKVLRIGILQAGKIVAERVVERESVTIGQAAKNMFALPAATGLPSSFILFEFSAKGYALNFTAGMDGRISLDEHVVPLPHLRQSHSQKSEGLWSVFLNERSRGKLVIGDLTVLFQFVAPPPKLSRPQLPCSIRNSPIKNLDWALVMVLAASFLAHFGFVIYLRHLDWPRKPDIEEIPDRFVKLIVPRRREEPKRADVGKDQNKEEAKKAERKHDSSTERKLSKPPKDPETEARAAQERRAQLTKEVAGMGVLKILGARGEGGAVADLIGKGDVSGDADQVFAAVGGVGVGSSGSRGLGGKGAAAAGSLRGGGSLRASGPGTVGSGERGGERAARAIVKDSTPTDVDGALDTSVIVKEIRSRLGAVKACYEAGLKRNPNIGGRIELRFEVSAIGKVTSAQIENDTMHDDEVAACIKSRVSSWRFPAPSGGSAQFSYPFIFQSSK